MKMRTKQPQNYGTQKKQSNSPKREIHSISGLPEEIRKISNKQPNFTLKGTRKRTANKAQSE